MKKVLVLAALTMLAAPAVLADEVSDALSAAQSAYEQGNVAEAKRQTDIATGYLAAKMAEKLKSFLPAALEGWNATDGEASALPAALLGGGMTANRRYDKGSSSVDLTIMADSPMMSMFAMYLANPQMLTMTGGQLKSVNGQQAVVTPEGEVQMLIANRFFVTISGSASVDEKLAYAGAIDAAGLATF